MPFLLILFAATNDPIVPNKATDCSLRASHFDEPLDAARINQEADQSTQLGVALRDDSLTVIGLCMAESDTQYAEIQLRQKGELFASNGGMLRQAGHRLADYLFFPATDATSTDVIGPEDEVIARLQFGEQPKRECQIEANPPFSIAACGAVVVADWQSHLDFSPSKIQLLDISVRDAGKPRSLLGYYQNSIRSGSTGMNVRFGFRWPQGNRVSVDVDGVYLIGDPKNQLSRPRQFTFCLRPAHSSPPVTETQQSLGSRCS